MNWYLATAGGTSFYCISAAPGGGLKKRWGRDSVGFSLGFAAWQRRAGTAGTRSV